MEWEFCQRRYVEIYDDYQPDKILNEVGKPLEDLLKDGWEPIGATAVNLGRINYMGRDATRIWHFVSLRREAVHSALQGQWVPPGE